MECTPALQQAHAAGRERAKIATENGGYGMISDKKVNSGDVYTVDEVADLMQCSTRTILRYIHLGRIHAVKIGRRYMISADEIERVLESPTDDTGRPQASV